MSFDLSSTPFSADSLWNQQVPTGATYTPLNWPGSDGWNYSYTWDYGSPPVYVASSSDPVVQVSVPASWGWPGGTVSIHVPVGATGGAAGGVSNADTPILIIDGDTVYNFWKFDRTSNTTATATAYGMANVVTGTGWGTNGQGAGIVAVGASELGGLVVEAQTDTGTINHALQLAVQGSLLKPGYVAPAIGGDGHSSTGIVQEGQLLAIAPGTTMPSGLSPLGQTVFRALQQYGAYVTDNGVESTVIRAQANAYDAATMDALRLDLNKFLPMLSAVSGGSPTAPTTPTSPITPPASTTPTSPITPPASTTPTTPTAPTTPTTPTTPTSSVTRPVLTVADDSLKVYGRGGTVNLGTKVTTTDTNDRVSMNITGLPKYETITSALDGQTFRGRDITLTAAQVNSGLTLTSNYRGGGHPVAELTLTARAQDPVTGAVASSAPQTIIVTDPRPTTTTATTASQTSTVSSVSTGSNLRGQSSVQQHVVTSTAAPTAQGSITGTDHALATATSAGFLANQGFERLQQHVGSFTNTLATGTGRAQATVTDPQLGTGTTTASLASQSFALLNQYLAGNTGRVDSGQIVSAVSQGARWTQDAILTRPH